jgi:hypothetical protein
MVKGEVMDRYDALYFSNKSTGEHGRDSYLQITNKRATRLTNVHESILSCLQPSETSHFSWIGQGDAIHTSLPVLSCMCVHYRKQN